MLQQYRKHVEERAAEGVVPKPLAAGQVAELVELIKQPPAGEETFILDLLAMYEVNNKAASSMLTPTTNCSVELSAFFSL